MGLARTAHFKSVHPEMVEPPAFDKAAFIDRAGAIAGVEVLSHAGAIVDAPVSILSQKI